LAPPGPVGVPAVPGVVAGAEVGEIAVGLVGEGSVVVQFVPGDLVAPRVEEAQPRRCFTALAMGDRWGGVGVWGRRDHDAPGSVVRDSVVAHLVVAATGDHNTGADRPQRRGSRLRDVRVVVVVHEVVTKQGARPRPRRRTGTVLR